MLYVENSTDRQFIEILPSGTTEQTVLCKIVRDIGEQKSGRERLPQYLEHAAEEGEVSGKRKKKKASKTLASTLRRVAI